MSLAQILGIAERRPAPVSEPDEKIPVYENTRAKEGTAFALSDDTESLLHILGVTRRNKVESMEYRKTLQETADSLNTVVEIIENTDEEIAGLEEYIKYKKIYEDSLALMREYKTASDRFAFREKHIKEFRAYDAAKKVVFAHKEKDGELPSIESVSERIDVLRENRDELYKDYLKLRAGIPSGRSTEGVAYKSDDSLFSTGRSQSKGEVL